MFSEAQYTDTEILIYTYFIDQEPAQEEEKPASYPTHVYEENGVYYCASATQNGVYWYTYCLNNPLIYTDPDGEWFVFEDAIIAGVGFVFGYVGHGLIEGDWGWDAVKSGLVTGGAAWLTYNTAGAASGLLADIGINSVASTVIGNGIGGAVGSFAGDVANQMAFNETGEKIDFGQAGKSALYGFGGGLAAGVIDVSPIAKWDFPMNHTVKHLIRTSAYEIGGNILSGEPVFDNMTYGFNPGIIMPLAFDVVSISGSILTRNNVEATIGYGHGFSENYNQNQIGRPISGPGDWYLEKRPDMYGLNFRDSYTFNLKSKYPAHVLWLTTDQRGFLFRNSIYLSFIKRWQRNY